MMPSSLGVKVHTAGVKFRARVLIIDDEPLVRWSLSSGLRSAGFDAVTASCSAEALALARQQPTLDLVLLDSCLYDADPRVLTRELQRLAPRCRFFILHTAGYEVPLPWDGLTVVEKPYDLPEVVRLVDRAVASPGEMKADAAPSATGDANVFR
jgi:two-component system, OmpR family, response regulator